jgi:DNA-binding SARP family transcriptional activator
MEFRILGHLEVRDDHGHELAVGGAKQRALLAILILHANEVASTDRLIESLWGDQRPHSAAKSLQVQISRLRRALGDGPLVTRNGGYLLRVAPDELDSARFTELLAEGTAALAEGAHARSAARLRAALELWKGDPLSDFAYEPFAQDEIARLDELHLVALEARNEAELALGHHAQLISELQTLVARQPLRERLRGQLMLALYRSGRQAEALDVYRAGRRALVEELGLEPGEELRALERAILAHDEALVPAPRSVRGVRGVKPAESASSAPFVGYERELSALEALLERTLSGRGALGLVIGEPGIGKSRLAEELTAVGRARGAEVLWGHCWDAGGAPAYWPWIQALRSHIRGCEPDELRAQLGAGAAEIAELLPELRDLLPDLPEVDVADAQGSRFRLFDAVAGALRRAAERRPLIVVLDDLHAADEPTLLLLQFLEAELAEAAVLILATYRDTEVGGEHPLRPALAELGRAGNCVRLAPEGLTTEDTAHFVELSAGAAPMPRLASALHDASGGNPLFVSELARLLAAEGRLHELEADATLLLPDRVGEVIVRRLHRLSERCRRTLALAAVAGREFEAAVVETAGASTGETLLEDLAEASAARMIEVVPGVHGRMRFSHELVRHALYTELGAVQRSRLHQAIGEALEQLHASQPEPSLPELAHHFAEALPAGKADKAVDYLARAGDRAAGLLAYEEAIRLYGHAAEIARASGATPATRGAVLVKLGEQLVMAGEAERAVAALDEAEAAAGEAADGSLGGRITVARAHVDFFDACAAGKDRLEDAITLFQKLGDPAGEARAWWALRTWHQGLGQVGLAQEAAKDMLDCARQAGSKGLASQAAVGLSQSLVDGPTAVSDALPRVQALRRRAASARTESPILIYLAELEAMRGRFTEARALVAESRARVTETGASADALETATFSLARIELWADDALAAERLARAGCERLERRGLIAYLRSYLVYIVDALIDQGRLEDASAELARAEALHDPEDVDAIQRQARARARIELATGNVDAAERSMRTALEYAMKTELVLDHAQSWLTLGQVLLAGGRDSEAQAAASEALAIAEAKEHTVFADRARALLGSVQATAAR